MGLRAAAQGGHSPARASHAVGAGARRQAPRTRVQGGAERAEEWRAYVRTGPQTGGLEFSRRKEGQTVFPSTFLRII